MWWRFGVFEKLKVGGLLVYFEGRIRYLETPSMRNLNTLWLM